jgi:DNA-binding response OmpR family regulator
MKVLVVDDEPDVANLVKMGIAYQRPDYEIGESHSGADALERAAKEAWDLVILDLTMPGVDGFTVLGALRGGGSDVPIIVLTARDAEQDRVRGLELGADDYVTKPFSPRELVARVRAVLRRSSASSGPSDRLAVGPLTADLRTRRVTVDGTPVDLTTTEFDLLTHLMRRPDRVCSREELLAEVWGYPGGTPTRTVDVHVAQLRAKLGDAVRLRTVRGVGYAVEPQGSPGTSASP